MTDTAAKSAVGAQKLHSAVFNPNVTLLHFDSPLVQPEFRPLEYR
jgi:hypothetical protein